MRITTQAVPMVDLQSQYRCYRDEIDEAITRTVQSGRFTMGAEVAALQEELSAFCGARHALCCSSGTEALLLALRALGVGPGDEVVVPDFTFIATAECVALVGAVPVFADVRTVDFCLDPAALERSITDRTRAVIAVSLFGQPADMKPLFEMCSRRGLYLIEDAAQSFGARYGDRFSCSIADVATTSFYPSKPLGGYGEGGAVFTNDAFVANKVSRLLNHGQTAPYVHDIVGTNARMDEIQAAVLRIKLRHLPGELLARNHIANLYAQSLTNPVIAPVVLPGRSSVWAQYTVRAPEARDRIADALRAAGIASAVYYPVPLHRQNAFGAFDARYDEDFPATNALVEEVISLPMHAFLSDETARLIAHTVMEAAWQN